MFIRYISHEIRNPLNVVSLGLEVVENDLKHHGDSHVRLEVIQDTKHSCDIALCSLNDMLTADKIQSGFLALEKKSVSFYTFIRDASNSYIIQVCMHVCMYVCAYACMYV